MANSRFCYFCRYCGACRIRNPMSFLLYISKSNSKPVPFSFSNTSFSNLSFSSYATMANSALRPLSCNWSRFSSFLGKYIAPQYGWWFHQRVGGSRTPLSFEHRRANPKMHNVLSKLQSRRLLQGLIKQREIELSCHISTGQYQSPSGLLRYHEFTEIYMN